MKKHILTVFWIISIHYSTNGQSFAGCFTNHFSGALSKSIKAGHPIFPGTNSPEQIKEDSLRICRYDYVSYLQKARSQKINGLVLMTGGSLMSVLGIRQGLHQDNTFMVSGHNGPYKYEKILGTRLALAGLVVVAGSIPYIISSLKNKKLAGLKLTCQKTSFGALNKARKKVTGLTFSIPIGK